MNGKLKRRWIMAKHEFGVMQNEPEHGKWYDEYEPEKYNCILM